MYALGTGYQRAAKNSRVSVEDTALAYATWDVTVTGDDIPTENFESDGFNEGILGFQGCAWNTGGLWDAGENPYDDAIPGLYPRDDLADLAFYENVNDGVFWNFPLARVRSSSNGGEVKGAVTFKASGMSQGEFTFPDGDNEGSGDSED